MANELQVDYITGRTVYFLIRNTVAQILVPATPAFVTYVTADLANYDVAATEQGTASGYYTGDMPTIPAGYYYLVSKDRQGVSPSEIDPSCGGGEIYWDGTAVIDTGNSVLLSKRIAEGDRSIDTSLNPWNEVITIKGTATELIRKRLRDTTGVNVTSTAQVIGSAKDT